MGFEGIMPSHYEKNYIKRVNYFKIKELIRISFGLGVNLTSPTLAKESLRIINLLLVFFAGFSMYGHWSYIRRYISDIPKIAESICTLLQTVLSIMKMMYFLFIQRKLHELLNQAQTHEIVLRTEILQKDYSIKLKLRQKINEVMNKNWQNIRYQLLFYIISCAGIISTYFLTALLVNMYHAINGTPHYKHILPFPAVYPIWESKGMTFPYYHTQMILGATANYIAGMGAVSFDGVFIVLCVHGISLIQVLNILILNSTSSDVPRQSRDEYLRYCIVLYQQTYNFVLAINSIYKHISLFQFLSSLIVWGIVLFEMSVGLESSKVTLGRMILFISASGFEVIIYCFNSQRLTTEYEKIPNSFYCCKWYDESVEFKKLILMMILRTNPTFNLKISWFADISLATFLVMVKNSGSYFLILRNLADV